MAPRTVPPLLIVTRSQSCDRGDDTTGLPPVCAHANGKSTAGVQIRIYPRPSHHWLTCGLLRRARAPEGLAAAVHSRPSPDL
eukprot:120299-Prorocentrum_minimum.AAC.2